eukprot:CAMPEP_0113956450 /NCGR_PEP_ID=MMETSP0011_2-20120614/2075_1 /TAXON_ID=101924 /ORGANISM="Rhodosorus marinus" /LENGTH=548 /DNA_ID=CAMNT_0000966611 /DNA_START=50 /DNA_END=1696 /DNA_ORIENTATION=- /assembly_acc=CAM_ASM_000156
MSKTADVGNGVRDVEDQHDGGDGDGFHILRVLKNNAVLLCCVVLLVFYSVNYEALLETDEIANHEAILAEIGGSHELDRLETDGVSLQEPDAGGFNSEDNVKLTYGTPSNPKHPLDDRKKNIELVPDALQGTIDFREDSEDVPPTVPPPPSNDAPAEDIPVGDTPEETKAPMNFDHGTPSQEVVRKPAPADFDMDSILASPLASRLIVSETLKAMYCPLPKIACSNWKSLFRKLEGFKDYKNLALAHDKANSGLKYLKDYTEEEALKMVQDPEWLKFVFVRDPASRLLSAYLDKFDRRELDSPEFIKFFDQLLGFQYRKNAVELFMPSFEEFIMYVGRQNDFDMNEHWAPQVYLCQMDKFPYDFVGRFENYDADAFAVLDALGQPQEEFPSQSKLGFPSMGTREKMDEHFTDEIRTQVELKFERDYRLLSYATSSGDTTPLPPAEEAKEAPVAFSAAIEDVQVVSPNTAEESNDVADPAEPNLDDSNSIQEPIMDESNSNEDPEVDDSNSSEEPKVDDSNSSEEPKVDDSNSNEEPRADDLSGEEGTN